MRYVLRADASQLKGSGHVMRASAIAEVLIARGEEVIFVGLIADMNWVEDRIKGLGFAEIYESPIEFISKADSDLLILDSYEISINDSFIAPDRWLHIVAIVDEQTPNYQCNLRIHPGLDASWVGESNIPILSGPRFIPFRSSLEHMTVTTINNNGVLRIAVVAGGSDPFKLVIELANILAGFPEAFEVFLFSNSAHKMDLDSRFHVIEIGKSLDELTRNVDLVFTTSSTSSFEFIARGMCVGVACVIENQKQNYSLLGELEIAAQIGIRNSANEWELNIDVIRALVTSPTVRQNLKSNAFGLIDFSGAKRIVDAIAAIL